MTEPQTLTCRLEFRILGPLELYADQQAVPIAGARQRTVLAMLVTAAGRVVPVDTLVEAVWNGHPPATGRTQVAICVAGLRKTLRAVGGREEVLQTCSPGYSLAVPGDRVDAEAFSSAVERARSLAQQHRTERAVETLREALALWRGPALANIRSALVQSVAARLEEERLSAYEQYIALRLELGQHRALIGELTDLVHQHPTWEQARAYLMLAFYRCGRRAEALEVFREARESTIIHLGLEPGPVLTQMHLSVLRDDPSLVVPAGPVVFGTSEVVPAQLPADEPGFVGRDEELAALDEELLGDRTRNRPMRWGQLTGAVGVGKSALAVHWAHRVAAEFPDGQLFMDLRGYDQRRDPVAPANVLDDFIRALGRQVDQLPDSIDARVAYYHSLLADRRILIVLDNARSFAQVQPLLPGTGTCRVVVTAREPLAGPAALRLRLAPLAPPQARSLLRLAVGDGRIDQEPGATSRLVEVCEGLPLALRAAAARLAAKPHWSVTELVRRLEDRERRLDELERGAPGVATGLELTYRTLPPPAATMFRRLALLRPPAVPACVAAGLLGVGPDEAEEVLEQLVDAQLVEAVGRDGQGRRRFRLDGLRRLYAQRCVARDDELAERREALARVRRGWPEADLVEGAEDNGAAHGGIDLRGAQ